jgi:general secretion pathway protein I
MSRRGFTLLEMMVATLIMGIAVVGLLSGISASTRNAARVGDSDRAVLLARAKMDELLLDRTLARGALVRGPIHEALLGGRNGGWIARVTGFENPPVVAPGIQVIDRIELQVWWMAGEERRTFNLDGYRTYTLQPRDLAQ